MKNLESLEGKNQIEKYLKQIIEREGIKYLTANAYAVYQELSETGCIDQCSARLILTTLLAGTLQNDMHDEAAF